MHIENTDSVLTVHLSGEIDHHNASALREKIDTALIKAMPKTLVLDFSGVSFMDSSGVGLVMGRYALAAKNNCRTAVRGLKERDRKILMMSGLQQKIEFR